MDLSSVDAEIENYKDDDDPLAEKESFETSESSMGELTKYFMTDKFVDNTDDISMCTAIVEKP